MTHSTIVVTCPQTLWRGVTFSCSRPRVRDDFEGSPVIPVLNPPSPASWTTKFRVTKLSSLSVAPVVRPGIVEIASPNLAGGEISPMAPGTASSPSRQQGSRAIRSSNVAAANAWQVQQHVYARWSRRRAGKTLLWKILLRRTPLVAVLAATWAALPASAQGPFIPPMGPPRGPWDWTLGLSASGGYDSNVLFIQPDGAGDYVSRYLGEASAALRTARTSADLYAMGSGAAYRVQTDLDQFTYQVGGDAKITESPRLETRFGAMTQSSLSTLIGPTGAPLPLLPLSLSHTTDVNALTTYKVSPTTTATANVDGVRVTFNTPGLVNASVATMHLALTHEYELNASYGGFYESQFIATPGLLQTLQTAEGTWSAPLGPLTARANAGATVLLAPGNAAAAVRPAGGFGLAYLTKTGNSMLRYDHTLSEAYGIGRVLTTDEVGVSYDRGAISDSSTAGYQVILSAYQGWSTYATSPVSRLSAAIASAEVRRALLTGLWVGAGAYLRRRDEGTTITSQGLTLTMGYSCLH